jgi:hypothetical protein
MSGIMLTCNICDIRTAYDAKHHPKLFAAVDKIIKENNMKYLDVYKTDVFKMSYHMKDGMFGCHIVQIFEKIDDKLVERYHMEDLSRIFKL